MTKLKEIEFKYNQKIGSQLKKARVIRGFSQAKLGNEIGMSFQQIQKYEKSINRISGGKFKIFSEILDFPISFFFETVDEGIKLESKIDKRLLKIINLFNRMSSKQKDILFNFIKLMKWETE